MVAQNQLDVFDNTSSSLIVAVRVRPILKSGVRASEANQKDILRVMNDKIVVVMDPDDEKSYLDQVQGRTKEKNYTFDVAFGQQATNQDVYNSTIRDLCLGCMQGHNVTVFAYGATGSGKTFTMVGNAQDPGLMVLSLKKLFHAREGELVQEEVDLTCSYIEVYNEVVYDLLVKNSGALELREDPKLGVCVAGIKQHAVSTPDEIMALLEKGNSRRKTDATAANATSSRSHAVLEIAIAKTRRSGAKTHVTRGKLCLVDLAGSERAAETNNMGQKLRDGANINKSLLALANCINALGKASKGKGGKAYVPYRDSKLTRLLKDGLSGNCKTAMIATVSASADQYLNTINTLKYADRAKEIKTNVKTNVQPVESHLGKYHEIISSLQGEVQALKVQLEETKLRTNLVVSEIAEDLDEIQPPPDASTLHNCSERERMRWLNEMSTRIQDNTEARINLQKALLEVEDANACNKAELQQLRDLVQGKGIAAGEISEAKERISSLESSIRENGEASAGYMSEIQANEQQLQSLQAQINAVVNGNSDAAFLEAVVSFHMQAVKMQELQFQMAVRDQVIAEQRNVINNIFQIVEGAGLSKEDIQEIARERGIVVEGLDGADPKRLKEQQVKGVSKFTFTWAGRRAKARYDFWKGQGAGLGGLLKTIGKTFMGGGGAIVPGN